MVDSVEKLQVVIGKGGALTVRERPERWKIKSSTATSD
jgi:hypothetical protein